MATPTDVLTAFRRHLVDEGIVRIPGLGPTDPPLPPMFVEPEAGPLSPNQIDKPEENDPTLVLSIFYGGAVRADTNDAYRVRGTIDVRLRSRTTAGLIRAAATVQKIRAEMFEPGPSPGIAKQGWTMAGVPIIQSGEWAALGRVGATPDGGYDHVWKAYLEFYA